MILLKRLMARNFKQLTDIDLTFPAQGTFLIEGANEAGKSSLFEAIFFALYGHALITDRDYRLENLRKYGEAEAQVQLEFSIEGRPFSITRRIVGNGQRPELTYTAGAGEPETIRAAREVTRILSSEMRLSANALLNTCFVEQKRLEQLENLTADNRRQTINELLNLRVLTQLDAEFSITREDKDNIEVQKGRMETAHLDAELPRLQAQEQAAWNCLRFVQWEDLQTRIAQWEQELVEAQQRQNCIQQERGEIADALQECERLKTVLHALRNSLALQVPAWQSAEQTLHTAEARARQLQELSDALPQRETDLYHVQTLCAELETLESLESELLRLQNAFDSNQREIARWDDVEKTWQAGKAECERLDNERARIQNVLRVAETSVQERQAAHRRMERLARLLQPLVNWERAGRQLTQIAGKLEAARQSEQELPALRERLVALEHAVQRWQEREENRREAVRLQNELDAALKQQALCKEQQERITSLQTEIQTLNGEKEARENAASKAEECLRSAQRRDALEQWAEAAERLREANPGSERRESWAGKREQAQARLERAEQEGQKARKQTLPGIVLVVTGLAGIGIGALTGLRLLFLVLGGFVSVTGGLIAARGSRAAKAARQAQEAAKNECAGLDGEGRALDAQIQAGALQQQNWEMREMECRTRLLSLNVPVPAEPGEARRQSGDLPSDSPAALETIWREAEKVRQETQNEWVVARRSLGLETAALLPLEAIEGQITDIKATRQAVDAALQAGADLPTVLDELGVAMSAEALKHNTDVTRNNVARVTAEVDSLPGWERQRADKEQEQEAERANWRELAQVEGLPEEDAEELKRAIGAAQDAFEIENVETPDDLLAGRVTQAREEQGRLERDATLLGDAQIRRREELDGVPRSVLEAQAQELERGCAENKASQQPLLRVRGELQEANLPVDSQGLRPQLASLETEWARDHREAEKLPGARQEQQKGALDRNAKRTALQQHWRDTLGEEAPAAVDAAMERLPLLRSEYEARLQAQDEGGLRERDHSLQRDAIELGEQAATRRHQQKQARGQQRILWRELGGETETREELLCRLPELASAGEHSAEEWEQQAQECRAGVQANRFRREENARRWNLEEVALNLDAETLVLVEGERALRVKRRAGEIVGKTRSSIISRVMPLTRQNMCQLLPLLTEGRYHDVKWDEANNVIEIFDTRASEFQRKRVFSGGARDQISLALRLGFALATLPGEAQARPGWLFLDEPLSSFDRARTQALVDLLTRGLIRRQFAQIFLVSHSESFDPGQFDYRLRMEAGRIVESNLPHSETLQVM